MKAKKKQETDEVKKSDGVSELSTSKGSSSMPVPHPPSATQEAGKPYNIIEKKYGVTRWFNPKFYYNNWKTKQIHKTIGINMELRNGNWVTFMVLDKEGGFKYESGYYRFDDEMKYYNITAGMWMYDYHQNFSIPLKRKIPISDVQKTVESSGITEVEYATNPATLERFTVAKIAEGVMRGQAIDDFLKQIRLILIIGAVASLIHLFLFMQKTGMLKSIKLPF